MSDVEVDPRAVLGEVIATEGGVFGNLPELESRAIEIRTEVDLAGSSAADEIAEQERILEDTKTRWAGRIAALSETSRLHERSERENLLAMQSQVVEGLEAGTLDPRLAVYARGLGEWSDTTISGLNFDEASEQLSVFDRLQPGARILLYFSQLHPNGATSLMIREAGTIASAPTVSYNPDYSNAFHNLDIHIPFTNGRVGRHSVHEVVGAGRNLRKNWHLTFSDEEIEEVAADWATRVVNQLSPKYNKKTKQLEPYNDFPGLSLGDLIVLDSLDPVNSTYDEARAMLLKAIDTSVRANPSHPWIIQCLDDIRTINPQLADFVVSHNDAQLGALATVK